MVPVRFVIRYEIKHAGPCNYTVSGGGATFDIDGYRGSTIIEAKQVGDLKSSRSVPRSSCPESVRTQALNGTREQLHRIPTIIKCGSRPLKPVEIITNFPGSKMLFERFLTEARVPGTVRPEP